MLTKERVDNLTIDELAKLIDHTLLKPDHTLDDVERVCEEAIGYGFCSVSVAPNDVPLAAVLLKGSEVKVAGAVGIPFGFMGTRAKITDVQVCIEAGAGAIDMVINLTAMKSGRYAEVQKELATIKKICGPLPLKAILETGYLTDEEKCRGCEIAVEAGADFVKTCTGFGPSGATVDDVRLMRQAVGDRARVKAAGGISTLKDVRKMLVAGADRIGTSSGVAIIKELMDSEE